MTFIGHLWQTRNSNEALADLSPQVSVLGPETHLFFPGWHGGPHILRPVLTPECPNPNHSPCGQCVLGWPETSAGAPSTSFPPCSDPHSTPAHPLRKLDLASFSENIQGKLPSADARCSQLGTPHTHTHTHSLRFLLGLRALGEEAKLGTLKAWSVGSVVRAWQETEAQIPSGPTAPTALWSGVHVRKLPVGQPPSQLHPGDPPPPSFLPQRVNLRSSWVSRESGNKGKESHFLSRGRKEAEIQPASHRAGFKLKPRAGMGGLSGRASRGCG